jgi:hypothetical protein
MDADAGASQRNSASGARRAASWTLLILGSVAILLTNVLVWVDGTMIDSNEFASVTSSVLDKPQVQERIADVMAEWVVENSDLEKRIADQLPPELAFARPLLERQLQSFLAQISQAILSSKTFAVVRDTLIERLHARVIAILRDNQTVLHTEGSSLVIDLRGPLQSVFDRLGVAAPARLQDPEATQLVVLSDTTSLRQASTFVRRVKTVAYGLLVFSVAAFGLTVLWARDRRGALKAVGLSLVMVGLVTLLFLFVGDRVIESAATERTVLRELVLGLESNLRTQSLILALLGAGCVAWTDYRVRHWLDVGQGRARLITEKVGVVPVALAGALVLVILLFAVT